MRILGIDPGLTATGFGCVEDRGRDFALVYAGSAAPPAALPLPERLTFLRTQTLDLIRSLAPAAVAVEQLFSHARHPRTAIQMAQARGVILEACAAAAVPVAELAARRVKRAVAGAGDASKGQVGRMVARHLQLDAAPESEHEADALALALCAHFEAAGARKAKP